MLFAFQRAARACEFEATSFLSTLRFGAASKAPRRAAVVGSEMTRRLGWAQFKASRLPAARARLEERWDVLIVDEEVGVDWCATGLELHGICEEFD